MNFLGKLNNRVNGRLFQDKSLMEMSKKYQGRGLLFRGYHQAAFEHRGGRGMGFGAGVGFREMGYRGRRAVEFGGGKSWFSSTAMKLKGGKQPTVILNEDKPEHQNHKHPIVLTPDQERDYKRLFYLLTLPTSSPLSRPIDTTLDNYDVEHFFGASLPQIKQILDTPDNKHLILRTKRPLTQQSFETLLIAQSRAHKPDFTLNTLSLMKSLGFKMNERIYNAVISSCVEDKEYLKEARRIFEEAEKEKTMNEQIVASMMHCLVHNRLLVEAFELFDKYALDYDAPFKPTLIMFSILIHGCLLVNDTEKAEETYYFMCNYHHQPDSVVYTMMIDCAARKYEVEKAIGIFEHMEREGHYPTLHTYNFLIQACAKRHDYFSQAFIYLEQMKNNGFVPNVHTYHALLSSSAQVGDIKSLNLVLDTMEQEGIPITFSAYSLVLNAYSRANHHSKNPLHQNDNIKNAKIIFDEIEKVAAKQSSSQSSSDDNEVEEEYKEYNKINSHLLNNYLSVFSSAGRLNDAEKCLMLYDKYQIAPDVVTFNLLLKMYSKHRRVEKLFDTKRRMNLLNINLDSYSYRHLIEGCVKVGYINNAFRVLELMKAKGEQIKVDHVRQLFIKLSTDKFKEMENLKEIVWPYEECRIMWLENTEKFNNSFNPKFRIKTGPKISMKNIQRREKAQNLQRLLNKKKKIMIQARMKPPSR